MKVALNNVSVHYRGGIVALRGVDLNISEGAMAILIGPSGAGKSSLLRCLNGSVKAAGGEALVDGVDIAKVNQATLREVRRRIALIPQQFNLIKRESVLANVLAGRLGYIGVIPGLLGLFSREDQEIARRNIARMGLQDKAERRVDTLSGGEQQRVAIARALCQQPQLILADEPVASLDQNLAVRTMELFRRINEEDGITMVIALHDLRLVERFGDVVLALDKGRIVQAGSFHEVTGKLSAPLEEPMPV